MFRCIWAGIAATAAAVGLSGVPAAATWSIVGVDPATGEVGVAVASCVGFEVTSVPVLVPGVGAAASQAAISEASGGRFVQEMVSVATAAEVVEAVVAADDRPDDRQFGVVVLAGTAAGWSGADTLAVAVDRTTDDGRAAAQGNLLADASVVDAALAAFGSAGGDLADRLLAGLVAGADAGGDRRCDAQTATAAALVVADPADAVYAETDASVFGVDPDDVDVPSVFVSVLVERGGERAPDRLAEVWGGADRRAEAITIRVVDDGAATAATRARTVVAVVVGVVAVVGAVGLTLLVRARRRARS